MMNTRCFKLKDTLQLFLGTLFLLVGGSIYLLFRDASLLLFKWCELIHILVKVDMVRLAVGDVILSDFIKYSLPDGLWIASYITVMDVVWKNKSQRIKLCWVMFLPIIAIASELLQLAGLLVGTFDILDLLCYTIPVIIYLILINYETTYRN